MTMSSRQTMSLELRESQLAKLTNDLEEIRMRALEQVETRFIRCLSLDEKISVKPVFMLKQLIRWFGCKPLLAADRVLAVLLELLRSEYADEVVKKIPHERLSAELDKIRKIVRSQESQRPMELLDDLQLLLPDIYDIHVPPTPSSSSSSNQAESSSETECRLQEQLEARFNPDDFEPAWTQPCREDVLTMKTLIDMGDSEDEMNEKLISLIIKMGDYPSEYFLQAPHIFLKLVMIQQRADANLPKVNHVLINFLLQLQNSVKTGTATLAYYSNLDPPATRPKQLRVESALGFLLSSCTKLLQPLLLRFTSQNWLILELIKEAVRTYAAMRAPIPYLFIDRLSGLVKEAQTFCYSATGNDVAKLVDKLAVPRLHSLICNGLLYDSIELNEASDKSINANEAKLHRQLLTTDIAYVLCMPQRGLLPIKRNLGGISPPKTMDTSMDRLRMAYTLGVDYLKSTEKPAAEEMILDQSTICLVVDQLGSKTLVKQLFEAVVECNLMYDRNPKLRLEAEILIHNLMNLRDRELRGYFYNLMRHPCGLFFHAVAQKSVYLRGCSNQKLIRQRIFGIPLNTTLLRQFVMQSWLDDEPEGVQAWCLQYLDLLINLCSSLNGNDFLGMYDFLQPVMVPLMICRSVTCSSLHNKLWKLTCPDEGDMLLRLRANVCYLFHPDAQIRIEAANRIAYMLQCPDNAERNTKVQPQRIGFDFGVVRPPWPYQSIFSASSDQPFQEERSLDALMRLLESKDLRPAIRKSTLTQLNVLLQNWNACGYFAKTNVSLVMVMQAVYSAMEHIKCPEHADCVLPAVSLMMKIHFHRKIVLQGSAATKVVYIIMTELLFETTHRPELRETLLICLFQLICHEHMTASESKLVLDVDLSSLMVPITYDLELTEPTSTVAEGLLLDRGIQQIHFGQDAQRAAQHLRLMVAVCTSENPKNIALEAVQKLDIRKSLKLTVPDLALLQASRIGPQLDRQLTAASNCSNHEELKQIVARIQTQLVLLRTAVPVEAGISLWPFMHKYLRAAPANAADREVYMSVSELCLSCMCFGVPPVCNGLNQALEMDPHHSFLLLLHDRTIGLDMLEVICQIVVALLSTQTKQPADSSWHSKLFMQLSAVARTHFEVRQLLHVRCLLRVLHFLSERGLRLSEVQLMYYIRHFLQLSSDLRSPTQTGSQWQRDCLHIVCQLHARCMPNPATIATPGDKDQVAYKIIVYLVGMCGHLDGQVRALAWVSLANCIATSGSSLESVLATVDFLPGGLLTCCLSTLMHVGETVLVRELAGRVFEMLMPQMATEKIIELLQELDFLDDAYRTLPTLYVISALPKDAEGTKSSCGIIGCYVAICSRLVSLKATWCLTLCEHRFMNCLSDVMKRKVPPKPHLDDFLELCAAISELYALCYSANFEFLQRSICRDSALLQSFLTLLDTTINFRAPERFVARFLKLFLVFCRDTNAYEFLFEQLNAQAAVFIEIFLYGTHHRHKGTVMQRYTLSALVIVCLKAQNAPENLNFVRKMEECSVTLAPANAQDENVNNKENNANALNNQQTVKSCRKVEQDDDPVEFNAVGILVQKLSRLFDHYFPAKTFNFLQPPGTGHMQIGESIGALLKVSQYAMVEAQRLKLLDRILGLIDGFLSDVDIGNASTYVKRVGAHKLRDILNNMVLLLNMLVQWHSSPQSVIHEASVAAKFVRVLVRIWPWLSHSAHIKCLCVQLAMFLTEHSLEMCKHSSVVLSGQSTSLLQLMVRVAVNETHRKETPDAVPHKTLVSALRVMMNCCACGEARLSLSKLRVLDTFDTILPATASAAHGTKVSSATLNAWLGFWEVYSRYDLGSKVCHLLGLFTAIERRPPLSQGRMLCLRILRNMSFSPGNRLQLVNNVDFISMLDDIVSESVRYIDGGGDPREDTLGEHSLGVLIVWKLFCFVAKYQAILRGTKLMKHLCWLQDTLKRCKKQTHPAYYQQWPHAQELEEILEKMMESMEKIS
ncbi:uncharacterized protein DMAD_03172 [Drosophila madeirensis]|uniref:Rotatin N-terminal domain-containing protein n=1 Tax=Drosophila madeirensis TaxID=30013 RepID=A0AAU9G8R5_DROMD